MIGPKTTASRSKSTRDRAPVRPHDPSLSSVETDEVKRDRPLPVASETGWRSLASLAPWWPPVP